MELQNDSLTEIKKKTVAMRATLYHSFFCANSNDIRRMAKVLIN